MIYIFDLDGTLALIEHRRHFVERPSNRCFTCGGKNRKSCPDCHELDAGWKPDWSGFYQACVKDKPQYDVILILEALLRTDNQVLIFSGRSDEVRQETIQWLATHLGLGPRKLDAMLTMRPAGDYTPDDQLKLKWLKAMPEHDRAAIGGVFEDRNRMVQMWRREGLTCFQVAEGDF